MTWGERFREIRKRKGVTQEELARVLGTKQEAISRFENGKENITMERAEQIASALGMMFVLVSST